MKEYFLTFFNSPLFGVTITVGAILFFKNMFKNSKNPLLNPLIFSIALIIAFLKITNIPYDMYSKGGDIISFFLGPVTVALAVPLYKHFEKLKEHAAPILIGITAGVITAITTTIGLALLFDMSDEMVTSLSPKATTTAIAIELSNTFGGNSAMTVSFVVIAGAIGFMFGEQILDFLKIETNIAKGIALGTASHAIGTNRGLLMSEEIGAMSSLAIGVAGLITAFLLPIILKIFGQY